MGEWKEYKLKDMLSEKGYIRGPFGSSLKRGEMKSEGIPVYEQQHAIYNIRDFRFFIDDIKFSELRRFAVEANDLIISCSGTLGKVSIIKESDSRGIISQALLLLRPDTRKILPEFLLYFFKTSNGFNQLVNASHGSVQQNIAARDVVENIPLSIPDKNIQQGILSFLRSLDDKIDLLHRQNKTLEALAETLFRRWFMEETEEGWETGKLGDVIELVYGKGLKEEIRTGRGFPVVGSSGVVGYHSEFLVEGPGIVIGRKGTLGKVIYLFENFFPIDTTYFIKSKVNSEGLFYEYFLLKTLNFEDMNTDSAVPGLNRELALSTEIIKQTMQKIKDFNNFCIPLFKKLKENNNQIRTLTRLRDTLLPKLMSGEVRVEKEKLKG